MKPSTVLLKTKITQLEGSLSCEDGQMCATGVLLNKMGFTKEDMVNRNWSPFSFEQMFFDSTEDAWLEYSEKKTYFYSMIGDFYDGMDQEQWDHVMTMNDRGKSFKEIGEWLKREGL